MQRQKTREKNELQMGIEPMTFNTVTSRMLYHWATGTFLANKVKNWVATYALAFK